MARLKDIAVQLDLAVSTVSRALNGHPHVDERTRSRVLAAAESLGYRPNALAQALRSSRTHTIGLVVPDILNPFYASSAAVLQNHLEQHGYGLVLAATENDPVREEQAIARLRGAQVDGIVLVPSSSTGAAPSPDGTPLPVVEMNRRSRSKIVDTVECDEAEGTRSVIEHLLALGHTRIAVIMGQSKFSTTRNRLAGIRAAMSAADLPLDEELVLTGTLSQSWGTSAAQRILTMRPRPTAIFATSDQLLLGALRAAREAGLRIPGDMALAGFGNREWAEVCDPPITTYLLPLAEMGMITAQLLLARLADPAHRDTPTHVRLTGELKIRASTAG
ncbi:LacI family transcriptional regulator [Saccharopolyspora sp. K220]|uniref:LacI family DNA-binding transcriptional regulator n=1 Tax=Saccharopolyspora soli TaxID=2926618 RepID=UPI001F55E88C|nr:LacI family DNA-binding transcriptional regulator [Saccharopolyspora soli]MCI2421754.1 LacI family transcriptional regulator [Saccharopolyspora soli]